MAIDEYYKPDSDKFIFLLTTRAGGLGINLTTADIVVLYDSDLISQADLQAMDRAHRIGQTKQVYVFRFITEGSVEERMLERTAQKLRLDQLVMQQSRMQHTKAANKEDRLEMIAHGAETMVNSRSQWEGEDFRAGNILIELGLQQRKALQFNPLALSKCERKLNYSVDSYFKEMMRAGPSKTEKAPKMPRAPTRIQIQDFQFFSSRLAELQKQELAAYKRANDIPAILREPGGPEDTPEKLEAERLAAQQSIDNDQSVVAYYVVPSLTCNTSVGPLTEEQQQEKEELAAEGFEDWRRMTELLAFEIQDKTSDEVAAYYPVFEKKWKELAKYPRIKARIEEGEAKRHKWSNLEQLLLKKIATHIYERIKKDITEFPVFHFDWFFKNRSPQKLQRRCNALLGMIEKDAEQKQAEEIKTKGPKGKKRGIEAVDKSEEKKPSRSSTPTGTATAPAPNKRAYKKRKIQTYCTT
ncbi:predicted protein [Postia placenta Mad-698-R]|nr:predicted protein [Postia placenta Mad-698-R]